MRTRSSSLPFLPLEVKHDILRFCDPSTLAKAAQVSLAFLELSSPLLYEDVHIHGIEALTALFSPRTQPPSLQIAPFLSLSQILNFTVQLPNQHLRSFNKGLEDLSLDRSSSHSPLILHRLDISAIRNEDDPPGIVSLSSFNGLVEPIHLCVGPASSSRTRFAGLNYPPICTRLRTLTLTSILPTRLLFENLPIQEWPLLELVTYQFHREEGDDSKWFYMWLDGMIEDLPMPEWVQVVVVVGSEKEKEEVLVEIREAEFGSERERVLSHLTVEVNPQV